MDSSSEFWSPAVTAAVISVIVTIIWNVASTGIRLRGERVERQRRAFAEAYQACVSYREFPYIIRRRRHDEPESERGRISDALSAVQSKLAYHRAWIRTESSEVAVAYEEMVRLTRATAGTQMKRAWEGSPVRNDAEMNIKGIGGDSYEVVDDAYMTEVRLHLSVVPRGLRRRIPWPTAHQI